MKITTTYHKYYNCIDGWCAELLPNIMIGLHGKGISFTFIFLVWTWGIDFDWEKGE